MIYGDEELLLIRLAARMKVSQLAASTGRMDRWFLLLGKLGWCKATHGMMIPDGRGEGDQG
jgi:hypothetical protein